MQCARRSLLVSCVTLALAAAGCSATPAADDRLVLEGTLVLRGNEPHTSFVLLRPDGTQWELLDVSAEAGRPLQNRQVQATGVMARPPGAGLRLPALRVTQLRRLR
jgi:hypothetical protein